MIAPQGPSAACSSAVVSSSIMVGFSAFRFSGRFSLIVRTLLSSQIWMVVYALMLPFLARRGYGLSPLQYSLLDHSTVLHLNRLTRTDNTIERTQIWQICTE